MDVNHALTLLFWAATLLTIARALITRLRKSSLPLPPGPRPWPIVGNIFDIPRSYAWIKATEWKDVYGKVYLIQVTLPQLNMISGDVVSLSILGKTIIFLNSFEAANDLLQKKSSIYSDRPRLVMLNEVFVFFNGLICFEN